MRFGRRFGLSGLSALGLSAVLAGSVAAASTSTVVDKNSCTTTGGANGYGRVVLQVTSTEYGISGVNKIKFISYLKYSTSSSGPWSTAATKSYTTPYFANDSLNHSYFYAAKYQFVSADKPWYWRLEITVKFLDRDGTFSTIHTDHVVSHSCSP